MWTSQSETYSLGLHAKNITDKEYITSGYNFVAIAPNGTLTPTLGREGVLTAFYGNPRQLFVTLGLKF